MNILPRLLFMFTMLPTIVPHSYFKELNGVLLHSFWMRKSPRLALSSLTLPKENGGYWFPDLQAYYRDAQLRILIDHLTLPPVEKWVVIEDSYLYPIKVHDVLWEPIRAISVKPWHQPALSTLLKIWTPSSFSKHLSLINLSTSVRFVLLLRKC